MEANAKDYVYLAIVDSASPFLTATQEVLDYSQQISKNDDTYEQYGDTIGTVTWRSVKAISVCDVQQREFVFRDVIVGVPSSNVVQETGGIYFGLLQQDKYRPTVLDQLGYSSFCLDYKEAILTLSRMNLISNAQQPRTMKLFDFTPFGSNVHHYGVLCHDFDLKLSSGKMLHVDCASLKRPVVVVLDSGLTGCVLNDSLLAELQERYSTLVLQNVTGARLNLPKVTLQSNDTYWVVSSFRLPWFDIDENDAQHPHVIAAGNTFLSKSIMTVDTATDETGQVLLEV